MAFFMAKLYKQRKDLFDHHRASCYPSLNLGRQEGSGNNTFHGFGHGDFSVGLQGSWMVFLKVAFQDSDIGFSRYFDTQCAVLSNGLVFLGSVLVSFRAGFSNRIFNSGSKNNCEFFKIIEQNCSTILL